MTDTGTRPEYSVLVTDDERFAKAGVLRGTYSIAMFVPEGEGGIAERIFCSDRTLIDILSDRSGFCLDQRMGELLVFSTDMNDTLALQDLEVILPTFETVHKFLYAGITNHRDDDQGTFGIGML